MIHLTELTARCGTIMFAVKVISPFQRRRIVMDLATVHEISRSKQCVASPWQKSIWLLHKGMALRHLMWIPLRELWGQLNPDRERIAQESCTECLGHPEFRVQFWDYIKYLLSAVLMNLPSRPFCTGSLSVLALSSEQKVMDTFPAHSWWNVRRFRLLWIVSP